MADEMLRAPRPSTLGSLEADFRAALKLSEARGSTSVETDIRARFLLGGMERIDLGERMSPEMHAKSWRLHTPNGGFNDCLQTIVISTRGLVRHSSVRLSPPPSLNEDTDRRLQWDISGSMFAMLAYYGLVQHIHVGRNVQYRVNNDAWSSWSSRRREATVTHLARLTSDWRTVVHNDSNDRRFELIAVDATDESLCSTVYSNWP